MTSAQFEAALVAARDAMRLIVADEEAADNDPWPADSVITEEINKLFDECKNLAMEAFDLW
jgi:hypothetical protein